MKPITRTFSSPEKLKRWLEDKYAECCGAENFSQWLTTFYEMNNSIEVNGILYTITDCRNLLQNHPEEVYKKSDLTRYAKELTALHQFAVKILCLSEEIGMMRLSKEIILPENADLQMKVAKRFAKYRKEEMHVDLENRYTQDSINILNLIIEICEENNWFDNE